jgi:hypothetical protein
MGNAATGTSKNGAHVNQGRSEVLDNPVPTCARNLLRTRQRVAGRPWPPPCACARRAGPPQRGHHGVACTREGPAVSYSTRGLSLVQSPRAVCCAGLQYECGPWPVQKNAERACRVAVGKRSHDRPKDICGARSRIYGVTGAVAPSNASSGATRFDYGRWRRELSSSRSASGRRCRPVLRV